MYTGNVLEFENGTVCKNGGTVPAPSTYKVLTHDIDVNAKRSESGYMNRNRVRANNYEIQCSWERLTWAQLIALIAAGDAESFTLTFLDARSQGTVTKTFYRDANMEYTMINIWGADEAYWTCSMNFVEI
jgi:hypothetical protein